MHRDQAVDAKPAPFKFRYRNGRMNLKALSSLDIDFITRTGSTEELQKVLDTVTFSYYQADDVKASSCETTAKVVNVMQLLVEYLLYCQEQQYQVINGYRNKIIEYKKCNEKLSVTNKALKEDTAIYQRQITTLKQNLIKYQRLLVHHGLGTGDAIELTNENLNFNGQVTPVLLDSIIQQEQETREYIQTVLKEQKESLVAEMMKLNKLKDESIKKSTANRVNEIILASKTNSAALAPLTNAIPTSVPVIEKTTLSSPIKKPSIISKDITNEEDEATQKRKEQERKDNEAAALLKIAAFEAFVADKEKKENELMSKERDLKDREKQLDNREVLFIRERRDYFEQMSQKEAILIDRQRSIEQKEAVFTSERESLQQQIELLKSKMSTMKSAAEFESTNHKNFETIANLKYQCKTAAVKLITFYYEQDKNRKKSDIFHHWEKTVLLNRLKESELTNQQSKEQFVAEYNARIVDLEKRLQIEKDKLVVEIVRHKSYKEAVEKEKEEILERKMKESESAVNVGVMTSVEVETFVPLEPIVVEEKAPIVVPPSPPAIPTKPLINIDTILKAREEENPLMVKVVKEILNSHNTADDMFANLERKISSSNLKLSKKDDVPESPTKMHDEILSALLTRR